MSRRRSRARSYLLLARVSNLPTVWTNVLSGVVLSGGPVGAWAALAAAVSLFYSGGMVLNDAFDAPVDRAERPDRPVPAGDLGRAEAFVLGALLLAAGEGVLLLAPDGKAAARWGVALAAAILLYDYRHKGKAYGPLVMALCRALIYVVAAAGAGSMRPPVAAAAATMWAYVVLLTHVAKLSGPSAGRLVPWLLAGICLVDATFITAAGSPALGAIAAAGFVVTLAMQRVVPGT